jgi:hypothetical protein
MRKLVVVAILASLLPASRALAAASSFTGTLTIEIASVALPVVPGAGTAIVNGSSGFSPITAVDLPAGAFATVAVVAVTDPGASPIKGFQLNVANAAGGFTGVPGSGSFGGALPLAGSTKVCLFGPCSAAVANVIVPLSPVGQGGSAFVTGAFNHTVIGAPWTTGTVSIGSLTEMGSYAATSSTATIQLVTPIVLSQIVGADAVTPAFAFLTLQLAIPEPGTLLLFGSGVVALVGYGRRAGRRRMT